MTTENTFHQTTASEGTYIGVRGNDMKATHKILEKIFNLMRSRGWKVQTDQKVLEDYPSIAKDHFEGEKGDLKFKSHRYPVGFEIEFYQDVNIINRNGGKYDFKKLKLMPYLIRCQFLAELKNISKLLVDSGYEDTSKPILKTAKEKVEYHIGKSISPELDDKKIASYDAEDKDGKRIHNGEIKYFRDHKGRLNRGIVYHNTNNMWWTVLNKYEYTNLASFELFDLDSEENRLIKLIKPSGFHNPKSRKLPTEEQIATWSKAARKTTKEVRVDQVNAFLSWLYDIDWVSRKFQFYIKESKRLGLQEIESNSFGIHKTFDKPRELRLYTKDLPMSYTESSWIKNLREYVVYGKPTIKQWFTNDKNGYGKDSYEWPEVREKLWKIGALIS
ncbi:hypothetical protein [Bacillus sp. Brlt_9]|uniref:hypothetical protein n=1 Tax=Bacillus sp. Brlt_9 TaxID=3110916 RepID=UPI003F7C9B98